METGWGRVHCDGLIVRLIGDLRYLWCGPEAMTAHQSIRATVGERDAQIAQFGKGVAGSCESERGYPGAEAPGNRDLEMVVAQTMVCGRLRIPSLVSTGKATNRGLVART
jgi:hypothetical protein